VSLWVDVLGEVCERITLRDREGMERGLYFLRVTI
jgi:hypothetical protein